MHCPKSAFNESNRLLEVRKRTRKRTRTKCLNVDESESSVTNILKLPQNSDSISRTQLARMNLIKQVTKEAEQENKQLQNGFKLFFLYKEDIEEYFYSNRLQNMTQVTRIIKPTFTKLHIDHSTTQLDDLNSRRIVKTALKSNRVGSLRKEATFDPRNMSSSGSLKFFLATSICLTIIMLTCFRPDQISCQRSIPASSSEPSIQFSSQSPNLVNSQPINSPNNYQAASERRSNDVLPQLKPQAIDQLMSLINSYQQSALRNQNQRPILPFSNQRNIQTSTPLNPFIGAQFQPNRQRQPTNNQGFPNNQQANQQTNSNQLFVPSSSATPYLTLNRIASLANNNNANNNQQQSQSNLNRAQFPQSLQPLNTIPLGLANSQQNRPLGTPQGNRLMPQQQQPNRPAQRSPQQAQFNQQQQPAQNGQQLRPTSSTPLPPILLMANPSQVKPISGFAPSGPPPNAASNNAMVIVQSPPNAIGQVAQQDQNNKSSAETLNATASVATTVVEDLNTDSSSSSEDKQAQFSTTPISLASSSSSPSPKAAESSSPTAINLDSQIDKQNEPQTTTKESSSWNPVEGNRSVHEMANRKAATSLSPSLDIVTVPPGYNPDNPSNQPQNYDISVSAQMGTPAVQAGRPQVAVSNESTSIESAQQSQTASTNYPSAAPTAITTIIWSSPSSTTDTYSTFTTTMHSQSIQPTKSFDPPRVQPTATSDQAPTRIRDNSLQNDEPDSGVVYGKSQTRDSKPQAPPSSQSVNPSPVTGQANIETSVAGRPFILPVQMDNQVWPFSAGAQQQGQINQQPPMFRSNHAHSATSSPALPNPFRGSRPLANGGNQSPMSVGSGFTITASGNQTIPTGDIQDYVAGQPPLISQSSSYNSQGSPSFQVNNAEPTISAQGGQDPASFGLNAQESSSINSQVRNSSNEVTSAPIASSSSSSQAPKIRRPTFKPKPAVPPIRIDSCIVGDDSSCDQSHNERCVTEYGISSCHCKPGYARLSQLRGYCSPVSSLQLNMKIDKLSDDRKLVFNYTLDNSNSEEYQYLEFETIQALASAIQQTLLARQFMGARVNKFFERRGKVWANVSVNFEANNMTKIDSKIQQIAAQELAKVANQTRHKQLGESTIMLDGSKEAFSRLSDINECANKDLNDCSKFATCTNEFGGFQCQCLPGFEDKYLSEDRSKHGRQCLGCSASYCSNRGECTISEGQKHCKCRPNFIGARCDIDSEVLAVAIGGSLVGIIILIITFWCLFVFNRRWKREQQKMDAMSATSGLTFNYVNSSTNSLMSPAARNMVGGLHRAGGNQVGAMAANYGQRFGAALVNGTRGAVTQHYPTDQQAIIGSTSSGSSAASQPIGCNPYAPAGAYQYEDGGLLIAPDPSSSNSSEQTSPSSNSYRGIMNGNVGNNTMLSQMAGNAYTLSGHYHHHHANLPHHHHHHHHAKNHQLSQFHPAAADYRTLNTTTALHYPPTSSQYGAQYDARWRTLQQDSRDKVGYYLVR